MTPESYKQERVKRGLSLVPPASPVYAKSKSPARAQIAALDGLPETG